MASTIALEAALAVLFDLMAEATAEIALKIKLLIKDIFISVNIPNLIEVGQGARRNESQLISHK